MKSEFVTTEAPMVSPHWQKVSLSDENDESKDECKFSIEIRYAKDISIEDKKISMRSFIHILNIGRAQPVNFKVDFSYNEAVKIVGNISEALATLDANKYLRNGIYSQIKADYLSMKMLEESSHYILIERIDPEKFKLRKFTKEELEDFEPISSIPASPPTTPTNKNSFFESSNNQQLKQKDSIHGDAAAINTNKPPSGSTNVK